MGCLISYFEDQQVTNNNDYFYEHVMSPPPTPDSSGYSSSDYADTNLYRTKRFETYD